MEGSIALGLYFALLLLGAACRFAFREKRTGWLSSLVCAVCTTVGWLVFVPMGTDEGNFVLTSLFTAFSLGVILCGLVLLVLRIFQGMQKGA